MVNRQLPFEVEKIVLIDSAGIKPQASKKRSLRQTCYKVGKWFATRKLIAKCFPDMLEALRRPARQIVDEVADVLRKISPELVSDVQKNGIVLTGGGSQIWGMDLLIQERTGIKCMLADDADSCVARGCGKSLEWIGQMQEGIINIARSRLLKE